MSTVVSVKNWTKTAFQTTTVVFSELDTHLDDFWEPKVSNPVIESNQKVVFGKMVHPSELTSGANFLVTLLLTVNNNGHACSSSHSSSSNGKDNFISLKTRIKGTKTGATVYCCASSYPETSNITKPQWRKGSDKHMFLCKLADHLFFVTYSGSWNDNVSFVIEEFKEVPVFMHFRSDCTENEAIDEIYENEWKHHLIGDTKYSHSHTNVLDKRPPFSTINGYPVPSKDQFMTPCPWWTWLDNWHIDDSIKTEDGWLYLDYWYAGKVGHPDKTKMRVRRWIRKRLLIKDSSPSRLLTDFEKKLLKEFYQKHSTQIYDDLKDFLPPFLKELKRDVLSNSEHYDLGTSAAIPSPKLRRAIKA